MGPAGAPPAPAGVSEKKTRRAVGWGSSNPKKAEEKPQIPLDIASYKLYYVNYEMRLTKATLVHLTKHETSHSPT
jgi:hypothetical protein